MVPIKLLLIPLICLANFHESVSPPPPQIDIPDYGADEETVLSDQEFADLPEDDFDLSNVTINDVVYQCGTDTQADESFDYTDSTRIWPNKEIPYAINIQFDSDARQVIAMAIKKFHRKTCIRFIPRQWPEQEDYVYFVPGSDDSDCRSHIGWQGGRQLLWLGHKCIHTGVVMHELMHAVGFPHEHCRADRDKYIEVQWKNIMKNAIQWFSCKHYDYLGEAYDYESIMHYGSHAFSKNHQPTIVLRKAKQKIGLIKRFSATDIRKLNNRYSCWG